MEQKFASNTIKSFVQMFALVQQNILELFGKMIGSWKVNVLIKLCYKPILMIVCVWKKCYVDSDIIRCVWDK